MLDTSAVLDTKEYGLFRHKLRECLEDARFSLDRRSLLIKKELEIMRKEYDENMRKIHEYSTQY